MNRIRRSVLTMFALLCLCVNVSGAQILCEGVLGNSGEQGEELVKFSLERQDNWRTGMGVAFDRFGTLWDRAGGVGLLNRYSVDGRLVGQYPTAKGYSGGDKLTLLDDTLVLLIGGKLYALDISAASGTEPKALDVEAGHMSFGTANGKVACEHKKQIFLLDPATGQREEVGKFEKGKGVHWIEMTPDGTVYASTDWKVYKMENGSTVDGWEKASPGERGQFLNGYWFGLNWHGKITRFNTDFEADPGVVQGGGSGAWQKLGENMDINNGRGMAYLGDNLYAVSGFGAVMNLLEWRPEDRRMELVRRIGAVTDVTGIGLDRQGRVWAVAWSWNSGDGPDAPGHFGIPGVTAPGCGQAVMLANDTMVAPSFNYDHPVFLHETFDKEINRGWLDEKKCNLRKGFVGSAVYKLGAKITLLVINSKGEGQAFSINSNGGFVSSEGDVTLQTGPALQEWTTLAMKDADTLLGAADGHIIEMGLDGNNWRETRRWNSWDGGDKNKFGGRIYICADDGRLWVSDRERHRIVCFALDSGDALASFGTADAEGTSLSTLTHPQVIAARGRRAVLFDSGNQRLMRLKVK